MGNFNTGNPLPSMDERDLYDNSLNLDQAINSTNPTWVDRFGVEKPTIDAALKSAGFMPAGFDFASGGTLQAGDRNKAVYNPAPNGDNNWYRWNGAFPKEIAANSQPNPKDENNWVPVLIKTGVVEREALRRIFAEAGLNLVEGSFELGGTLTNPNDILLQEKDGKGYLWTGDYLTGEKVVSPKSIPGSDWVCLQPKRKVSLTPEMFDDGVSDDTTLIKRARNVIQAAGGGTLTLTREYIVGKQIKNSSPSASKKYWQSLDEDFLTFQDCVGVNIYFNSDAKITFSNGLRYGSFDPLTGLPYTPPTGNFTNQAYSATPGNVIDFVNCKGCTVRNPQIDGNMSNIIVGGRWGDKGIQLPSIGIRSAFSVNIRIINPEIIGMPLDALYATGRSGQWINFMVYGGTCTKSGRQGFSWTGGEGVFFYGTRLLDTGKGEISSSPGAGIDIEDNGQGCVFGRFYDLIISNNTGVGVLALNTTKNIRFNGCEIAGETNSAIWASSNDVNFNDCQIYGTLVNCASNIFKSCYITNKPYRNGQDINQLLININSPVTFDKCEIDCYHPSAYNFNIRGGASIINTKIKFSAENPTPRARMGILGDVTLNNVNFIQNYTGDTSDCTATGERTFLEIDNLNLIQFEGKNTLKGDCLGYGSREGSTNLILNGSKQTAFSNQFLYTCVGAGPSFTIPMPATGTYIVTLTKTTGDTTLRNTKVTWMVSSRVSSSASNHDFNKLSSINETLGTGGSVEMGISNGGDAIILTQGSIGLNGETWTITISELSSLMIPV